MPTKRIILQAGLGNTGSPLAPLLVRMGAADALVLVDPDSVAESNMAAQAYGPGDVGRAKVDALADHLAGLDPNLRIERQTGDVEDLPAGYFGGTVLLCVDHDAARQAAAERTCWMGGTLWDIAVNGQAGLVRVTRITRGAERSCLECAWSDGQYANLIVRNSCRKTLPTRAPAALGAFAASLAALQLGALEAGDANVELTACPATGEMWRTRLPRNAGCRFDHQAPDVERLAEIDFTTPLGGLFALLETRTLEVPGFTFAGSARCDRCDCAEEALWLLHPPYPPCPRCGAPQEYPRFFARPVLHADALRPWELERGLSASGLRPGEVVRTDTGRWVRLGAP